MLARIERILCVYTSNAGDSLFLSLSLHIRASVSLQSLLHHRRRRHHQRSRQLVHAQTVRKGAI